MKNINAKKTKKLNKKTLNKNTRTKTRTKTRKTCCLYEKKAVDPLDNCKKNGPRYTEKNKTAFKLKENIIVLNHAYKHTQSVGVKCYDSSRLNKLIERCLMKGIIHTYKDSRDKEIEYADTTKMKLEEYLEHVSNKKHKVTVVCPDKHFEYILITCYIQNKKVTVVSVVKGKKDRNGKLLNDYEKGGSDLLSK